MPRTKITKGDIVGLNQNRVDTSKYEKEDGEFTLPIYFTFYGLHSKTSAVPGVDGRVDGFVRTYPCLNNTEDSDLAYAKFNIGQEGNSQHYIKITNKGLPVNPNGLYEKDNTPPRGSREKKWRYIKVSQSCFVQYLEFLQTKNNVYYNNAVREMM